MHLSRQEWAVGIFSLLYVSAFSVYYLSIRNYEFIWYAAVVILFFGLILGTIKYSKFTPIILWGLSIWGLLHMAGGSIPVGDGVLYGVQLIDFVKDGEFTLLKYDQALHAFGFGVATLVAHHLLLPRWKDGSSKALLYILAACVGMGLGALNEVIEFFVVLTVPESGVGGYYNTALDLLFNMIGAISAALVLAWNNKS